MAETKVLIKSAIVGASVLLIDKFIHNNYANPETSYYFIFKFFLGFILAYYLFENKDRIYGVNLNPLDFKKGSGSYYICWSVGFAALHGLYYRILEFFQGNDFFSRVGDINIFGFTFEGNIFMLALGWLLVHGLAFYAGILIANQLDRMKVIS